jgi:hypothetical protein
MSEVRVQLTPKVVIDVSLFAWPEFVNRYQLVAVVSEHLMNLKVPWSTLFDEI